MKEITVKIGGEDVKLSTSGYLVVLYSDLFGSNVFEDFGRIVSAAQNSNTIPYAEITTLYKLAYAMAKHSDPELVNYEDWLRKTEVLEIPLLADQIIDLWADETATQSTP